MKNDRNSKDAKTAEYCDNRNYDDRGKWQYHHYGKAHSGNAVYGLGFIGAAVFFIGQASSFWLGVLGILKAIVWPAILVYELLRFLV